MILPSQEIKQLSNNKNQDLNLISPFEDENLRPGSYDLTVGEEYYIGQPGSSSSLTTEILKPRQSFTIPPHAVCFIRSTENINLPSNITAKVSLRMTHIYAGLILSSQPPFDPNYHGGVIVMLNNLSSESITLKRGERLVTMEFSQLLEIPDKPKPHRSVSTIEEQLTKPLISSLTEIANTSASTQQRVISFTDQILMFAALIVAVLAVPGFFTYTSLVDRLGEQKDQIKDMSQLIDSYKRELNESKQRIEKLETINSRNKPKTSVATASPGRE